MTDKNKNPKKVLTGKFRVAFPAVFEPKGFQDQKPKYSLVMLFKKNDGSIAELKQAAIFACTERWGAKEKWPKSVLQKWPFKDGDEKSDLQGYPGHIYITPISQDRPGVVGLDGKTPITKDDQTFYAGCYARATVTAGTYPKEGVKGIAPGVTFYLNNVQKLADGEHFSGRLRPEDEFDAVEEEATDIDGFTTTENSVEDEFDLDNL